MAIDQLAGTDQNAEPDDLRASLAAQFDAWDAGNANSDDAGTPQGTSEDSPPVHGETKPALENAEGSGDRPRGPDGKFIAKTEAAPEAAAPVKDSPAKDKPAAASETASTPTDAPPAGWPADAKAEWSSLSPVLKAAVAKREMEISEGGRQWSEQRRQYERVLSPIAQETARLGMSVEDGLNALLSAHHALNRDPANAIRHLAQQYGVDLATLAGQAQPAISRETVPDQQPDISALVRQAVQPILAPLQERFAAEDRRSQEMTLATVTSFANAAGHEHFDTVQDELMALIPRIKAANPSWSHDQVLQDAYDRAVHANPSTRAQILAAKEAAAEEARRAQARAHATGARRAASSVTGNAPGPQATGGSTGSLRDDIQASIAQLTGG